MFHNIFGGIHLESRKDGTRRKSLAVMGVTPERVIIPVAERWDETAQCRVSVGDTVTEGQPIAETAQGVIIHASISGRVEAIEPRTNPNGEQVQSVVICADGTDARWPDHPEPVDDPAALDAEEIISRIEQAGVVGMGGGGYPAAAKLRAARGRVDTVIVNAAESEPYITADHRILLEKGDAILTAVKILMKAVDAADGAVAVEADKLNAVELLERKVTKGKLNVRVAAIPARYPLGAEKPVIKTVTGREVPPGGNAIDVNCVVFNAATAYAVYRAVKKGRPLTRRVVTVTGGAMTQPRNLWVPIGTPVSEVIRAAGGFREKPDLVLMGGPMMGTAQKELDVPVTKSTNSLICMLDWEHHQPAEEKVCIRCGRCVAACPMHLMPLLVDKELKLDAEVSELLRLNVQDCMGCGCCTYICPSSIPLLERMAQARRLVESAEKGRDGEVSP